MVHRWRIRVGARSAARWPGSRGRSRSPPCSASGSGATATCEPPLQPAVVFRTLQLFTFSLDVPGSGQPTPPQLWVALFLGGGRDGPRPRGALQGPPRRACSPPTSAGRGSSSSGRTGAPRCSSRPRRGHPAGGGMRSWWWIPDPVALATHHRAADPEGARRRHQRGVAAARRGCAAPLRWWSCTGDHVRNSCDHHADRARAPRLLAPLAVAAAAERAAPRPSPADPAGRVRGGGGLRPGGHPEQGGRHGAWRSRRSARPPAMEAVLDAVEASGGGVACPARSGAGRCAVDGGACSAPGALVDAAVLDLYRRRRLDLLARRGAPRAPGAALRARRARRAGHGAGRVARHRPAGAGDRRDRRGAGTARRAGHRRPARQLARHRPRQVLVLVPTDPDSGVAVALARHLGRHRAPGGGEREPADPDR